jgi:hypothetical protein
METCDLLSYLVRLRFRPCSRRSNVQKNRVTITACTPYCWWHMG